MASDEPLLQTPEPVYSSPVLLLHYASDATFSPRAMRPLYGATRRLQELLLPDDALPPGVVEVRADGSVELAAPPWEAAARLAAHYPAATSVAGAALLLGALLPLAGLVLACCRMCRACGPPRAAPRRALPAAAAARALRKAKRRAACRRAVLGLVLACVATAMLFGVVCAFVTNEYMQEGSERLPGRLRLATSDALLYLNNTQRQLSHLLVDNFIELRDHVLTALRDAGAVLLKGLRSALSDAESLVAQLESAREPLRVLRNATVDAQRAALRLEERLVALRTRALRLLERCKGQAACANALNASAHAADVHFPQVPSAWAGAEEAAAAAAEAVEAAVGGKGGRPSLAESVGEARAALTEAERQLTERVARAAQGAEQRLDDVQSAVDEADVALRRALAAVAQTLRSLADPALGRLQHFTQHYAKYRYVGDAGASAVLLAAVTALALGLLLGFCGRPSLGGDDDDGDCCSRAAGARWLCLAAVVMFMGAPALALWTVVHFGAGLAGHQGACAPLRPPRADAPLLAYAETLLPPMDGDDQRTPLWQAIAACHRNESAYSVLGLQRVLNADALPALADNKGVAEALAPLRDLQDDGGTAQEGPLLDEAAVDRLRALAASPALGRLDGLAAAAAEAAAEAEAGPARLGRLAQELEEVPAAEVPPGAGHDLRLLARDLRRAEEDEAAALAAAAKRLNASAAAAGAALRGRWATAAEAAGAAAAGAARARAALASRGPRPAGRLAAELAEALLAQTRAHLRRVARGASLEAGPCAPLSRALNASLVALCDDVLLPMNGWWVGAGLCLLLFTPALILAICLAKVYRRPRLDHYLPTGPDAEYLYDAYSDRDNIPLASAGKKRSQRRFHESYHDNAAGGGRHDPGSAYEFSSRHDPDARYADMAPKHWELPHSGPALPPRYLGPEYERPPPYYYPGPGTATAAAMRGRDRAADPLLLVRH